MNFVVNGVEPWSRATAAWKGRNHLRDSGLKEGIWVKMDPRETGCELVNWIELALSRVQCLFLAYFPKMERGLWDDHAVCVSLPTNIWIAW
jgi:hypothetical protein